MGWRWRLNSRCSCTKKGFLLFLDLGIVKSEGMFGMEAHRKQTHTQQYMLWESNHQKTIFLGDKRFDSQASCVVWLEKRSSWGVIFVKDVFLTIRYPEKLFFANTWPIMGYRNVECSIGRSGTGGKDRKTEKISWYFSRSVPEQLGRQCQTDLYLTVVILFCIYMALVQAHIVNNRQVSLSKAPLCGLKYFYSSFSKIYINFKSQWPIQFQRVFNSSDYQICRFQTCGCMLKLATLLGNFFFLLVGKLPSTYRCAGQFLFAFAVKCKYKSVAASSFERSPSTKHAHKHLYHSITQSKKNNKHYSQRQWGKNTLSNQMNQYRRIVKVCTQTSYSKLIFAFAVWKEKRIFFPEEAHTGCWSRVTEDATEERAAGTDLYISGRAVSKVGECQTVRSPPTIEATFRLRAIRSDFGPLL